MALADCVICCTSQWEGHSLRCLVEDLGGQFSRVLDSWCTHVITARTNTHRAYIAAEAFPDIPVVHPTWLWACFWHNTRVPLEPYATDFYTAAQRTGTSSALGSRVLFYKELPAFHLVEDHVLPKGARGRCMANLLDSSYFHLESPQWPFVSRTLQHTTFWGPRVREINWRRRCTMLMCLLVAKADKLPPRGRMRRCQEGPVPVLRHLVQLPRELWMLVVAFV